MAIHKDRRDPRREKRNKGPKKGKMFFNIQTCKESFLKSAVSIFDIIFMVAKMKIEKFVYFDATFSFINSKICTRMFFGSLCMWNAAEISKCSKCPLIRK